MLDLIEEVGGVHQRKGETRNGIFREKLVDVAADEIGAAQSAGLHGEAFGLEPFLQQRDLRRAAGAVHAFDDDQRAGNFGWIETDERFAEEILRSVFLSRGDFGRGHRLSGSDSDSLFRGWRCCRRWR